MLNWWCELPAVLPESRSTSSVGAASIKAERSVPVCTALSTGTEQTHREQVKRASPPTAELCPGTGGSASSALCIWECPHPAQAGTASCFGQHSWTRHSHVHTHGKLSSNMTWAQQDQAWLVWEEAAPCCNICMCRCGLSWRAAFQQDSRATKVPARAGISTQGECWGWRAGFSSALFYLGCPKSNSPRSNKNKPSLGLLPCSSPWKSWASASPPGQRENSWSGFEGKRAWKERRGIPDATSKCQGKHKSLSKNVYLAGSVEDTLSFEPLLGFLQQQSVAMLLQTCQDSGFLTDLCLPHCSYTTGTFGLSILWGCWSPWARCWLGRCSRGLEFLVEFCSVRQWLCGQWSLFNTDLTTSTESLCPSGSLFSFLPQLDSAAKRDSRLLPAWK